jgi:hypothetical protein
VRQLLQGVSADLPVLQLYGEVVPTLALNGMKRHRMVHNGAAGDYIR